jgi:hypothetical protein
MGTVSRVRSVDHNNPNQNTQICPLVPLPPNYIPKTDQIHHPLLKQRICLPIPKMSTTLRSKKKPELQALAGELGIDTDGSKADLEARILLHLSEHTNLRSNPKFGKYFAGITGPESPGPAASLAAGSHKRRSIAAKKSTDLGESISKTLTRFVYFRVVLTGSDEEGVLGTDIVKKTKRTASTIAKAADSRAKDIVSSIPSSVPSPARVTNQIELATSRLVRRARSASTSLQLHQVTSRVPVVRQAVSNVVSVDGIAGLTEFTLLINKLIPRTYPVPLHTMV